MWSSQLLNQNAAAVELHSWSSEINKQAWYTLLTAMVYHFLAP